MLGIVEKVKASPSLETALSETKIGLAQGGELDLASVLHLWIANEAGNITSDQGAAKRLLVALRTANVAARGIGYLHAGYNPICLFDGQDACVMPDFMISHVLSNGSPSSPPRLTVCDDNAGAR
jgi:hypothetical protein